MVRLSGARGIQARGADAVLALAGAVGFCTRVPVGCREDAWIAMTRNPAVLVVVAYPIGGVLAGVVALPLPPATVGLLVPVGVLLATGITHLDGLADVGDAAVVHGGPARRREVLLDTDVGVGAAALVALVVAALALGGLALAGLPVGVAAAIVVAAEVGAKLGMVALAGVGPPLWGDLGSQMRAATPGSLAVATLLAVPAVAIPGLLAGDAAGAAAATAVLAGPVAALGIGVWARRRLDGANGDCFGAANELARVLGLHLGLAVAASAATATGSPPTLEVIAWTLS